MKSIFRAVALVASVAAAALGSMEAARASEEIATKEKLACADCHVEADGAELADLGKYYELRRTTDGFAEIKATFGKCTLCHAKEPGSLELTERGEEFRFMAGNMEGLAAWTKQHHPEPPRPRDDSPPDSSGTADD